MISSAESSLGLLSTRSCSTVAFTRKDRTQQSMKADTTNVDRPIGKNPILLIRWAILAILLPNFSKSCLGSSVRLILCKACKSARKADDLNCCQFQVISQKTSGLEASYPRYFPIVSQRPSMMDASTSFWLREIMSQLEFHIGGQFPFPPPTTVFVRI